MEFIADRCIGVVVAGYFAVNWGLVYYGQFGALVVFVDAAVRVDDVPVWLVRIVYASLVRWVVAGIDDHFWAVGGVGIGDAATVGVIVRDLVRVRPEVDYGVLVARATRAYAMYAVAGVVGDITFFIVCTVSIFIVHVCEVGEDSLLDRRGDVEMVERADVL